MLKNVLSYHNTTLPNTKSRLYRISGIIRERKVSWITFFTIVREKTFVIQAVSYIKIPAEIKSARKHSRMLPDSQISQTFSSVDDSQYTVCKYTKLELGN